MSNSKDKPPNELRAPDASRCTNGSCILEFEHNGLCVPARTRQAPVPALPTDAKARKAVPLVSGCLDYFPAALAAVAHVSKVGNDQHNPGQPMHHARGKSGDHADCIARHLLDRGTVDTDGLRHSAKVAWRALALLQEELEKAGEAPLARGARLPAPAPELLDAAAYVTGPQLLNYLGDAEGRCNLCPDPGHRCRGRRGHSGPCTCGFNCRGT